jgi:hypothetical protein
MITHSSVRHCRNYAVESPDGHIGTVTEVIYAFDLVTPTALAIRAGRASSRLLIIPVCELVAIQRTRHRVTLRGSPNFTTSERIHEPNRRRPE